MLTAPAHFFERLRALSVFLALPACGQTPEPPAIAKVEVPRAPFSLADQYWQAAMFARTAVIETEAYHGRTYEVLLRDQETGETLPKNALKRGTAFLVRQSEGSIFLVTASHVAQLFTPQTQIAFKNAAGESRAYHLDQIWGDTSKGFQWHQHATNDVSVHLLPLTPEQRVELEPLAIRVEWLEGAIPERFTRLIVCGYPAGLGAYKRISPVSSLFTVASEEMEVDEEQRGIEVKSVFLASPPAGSGFSGGPVFQVKEGETPRCVGLLTGALGDTEGAIFSAVVPAKFILETMASAASGALPK